MYAYEQRRLSIQLVPKTSWYKNLKPLLPNWNEVVNHVRNKECCEICGKRSDSLTVDEIWIYNDETHEQSLGRLLAICKSCHIASHIGYPQNKMHYVEALEQYKTVNQMSFPDAQNDIQEALKIWAGRSAFQWHIDKPKLYERIRELTGINCDLSAPVNGKYYAKIPYDEKEFAKKYGARWDPERKMWYFRTEEDRQRWDDRWKDS